MRYIAVDFGASSGRVIVGTPTPEGVVLDEIHRFSNRPVRLGNTLYWDFLSLFEQLKLGLKKAFAAYDDIHSIGVDTWGVDFGLIGKNGQLLSNPVSYRDSRTRDILGKVFEVIPRDELYALTGNQLMEINTAFQLYSMVLNEDPLLSLADKLLFMPDLFNYFLSGVAVNEYTIASTSQLLHLREKGWASDILERLRIPSRLMQSVVPSGAVLGDLLPEITEETGGKGVKVVAVGSHDTASAVASLSPSGNDWAFLSSGTWSLMGIKVKEPILSSLAMEFDFTNEGTVDGEIRFLKNITGLWILQQVMAEFAEEGMHTDYETMISEAEKLTTTTIIDVDDTRFSGTSGMRKLIAEYCRNTNQSPPLSPGEYMRSITLSLASKYAEVKRQLELVSGQKINTIYVVGGGARNRLLNHFTAELTGCRVVAGEAEATAIGNILLQYRIHREKNN